MASIERKKHIRADIQEEIQCVNPVTPEENSTGVVRNISFSAMCLYVLSPVRIGQEITVKSAHRHYKKGVIVWCNKTGEKFDIYKAGLKFV
jgi:hypothetical protein